MNPDKDDQHRVRYFCDISDFFESQRAQKVYSDLMERLGAGAQDCEYFLSDTE